MNITLPPYPATDTATGVVELATTAEITAGTATNRAVTPAGLAGKLTLRRVAAQADRVSTAALTNLTDLTADVEAGGVYQFEGVLFVNCGAGGYNATMGGTCTASAFIAHFSAQRDDVDSWTWSERTTVLGTGAEGGSTAGTAVRILFCGTLTVSAAGTLTVKFGQSVSNAATSSVLAGSYLKLSRIS